jgi:putative ABC transport system permease protein
VMKFVFISMGPRRIIGVAKDVDDEHVVPGPSLTIYHPFGQIPDDNPDKEFPVFGGRLFVHTKGDPYALVNPVTQIIRGLSTDQPVERPATLEDIRAEVLTPDRLNTFVFSGFAAVALAIAIVGVGGVLAFSVSGRTREFGIRLAMGSPPSRLLTKVIAEGALMAAIGVLVGGIGGYILAKLVGSYVMDIRMPSLLPVIVSAAVLLSAAVIASAWPASRAARIDVMEALRSD